MLKHWHNLSHAAYFATIYASMHMLLANRISLVPAYTTATFNTRAFTYRTTRSVCLTSLQKRALRELCNAPIKYEPTLKDYISTWNSRVYDLKVR